MSMQIGSIVAGRFRVVAPIGQGGMGSLSRAEDLRTGRSVAVKSLLRDEPDSVARFVRESVALSSVRHEAIVGYVDHGTTEDGRPFLAMEWIDGEDLARRLERAALPWREAVALGARVADALGALHDVGVVHRDLKPANLVLEANETSRVRIVDLGIARSSRSARGLTNTGTILGTAGYMAPEQVEGRRDVDARADFFALGAVLFECLSGRPTFGSDDVIAVLARVLLDEAPRLRDAVPTVPAALDALVARLLSRDRNARPNDAREVSLALTAILDVPGPLGDATLVPTSSPPLRLRGELRPVSLVLARSPAAQLDATLQADSANEELQHAVVAAQRFAGRALRLAGGALALAFDSEAGAREQAARACRAAIELQRVLPEWSVAVSTAPVDAHGGGAMAAAIAHAAKRLASADASGGVGLDSVTEAMLDASFDVEFTDEKPVLRGWSPARDDARPLLGKLTPCIGREKELRLLESTLEECSEERSARAVLLVADAGFGKSKLRREFLARVRERNLARVIAARAEVGGVLDGMALLRSALFDAAGLNGKPAHEREGVLERYLTDRLGSDAGARASIPYLLELAGIEVREPTPELLQARQDPLEMRWRFRDGVTSWLQSEASAVPLVLSLEDLHQADASSIGLLIETWRSLEDRSVMVVGTARPEVENVHPRWMELRSLQTLRLDQLGRRATERLFRQALGTDISEATVSALVTRSDGHPFLIEELVRHVAAGRPADELPETIVALVQSRLLSLPSRAREFLRAASVFGERFDLESVSALLGNADVVAPVEDLVREELLIPPSTGGEDAEVYRFRHTTLHGAAYAMMPEAEKRDAHRTAAKWLGGRASSSAAAVAEQYLRGGEPVEAGRWFLRAARLEFERGSMLEGAGYVRRGFSDELTSSTRTEMVLLGADCEFMLGNVRAAFEWIHQSVPWAELTVGSAEWATAKCREIGTAVRVGESRVLIDALQIFLTLETWPAPTADWGRSLALLGNALTHAGMREPLRALLSRAVHSDGTDVAPEYRANIDYTRGLDAELYDDPAGFGFMRACLEATEHCVSPDRHGLRAGAAATLADLGAPDALALARTAREETRRRTLYWSHDRALLSEMLALIVRETPEGLESLGRQAMSRDDSVGSSGVAMIARAGIALSAPSNRAVVDAAFVDLLAMVPKLRPARVFATVLECFLAQLDLLRDHPADALARAETVLSGGDPVMISIRTWLHLTRIGALDAMGMTERSSEAKREASERIQRIARGIAAESDRAAFVASPFSARALAYGRTPPGDVG